MSKRVLKYVVSHDTGLTVDLPKEFKFVHADMQYSHITMWLEVPDETEEKSHTFRIFGTGHDIPNSAIHCGSLLNAGFVWHIYEVRE